MNNVYLYDEDYMSLLALIVELIKRRITPDDIKNINNYEPKLLDESIFLEIKNKYQNIKLLKQHLSTRIFHSIYYTFLSDNKNKEIIIYKFIRVALVYKDKVYGYRRIDCVNDIIKISRRVAGETHKLKGFLRFKELNNNVLYGVISPTNNVIEILANHFKDRLANESWIIKDDNRKIYALYDKQKITYLTENEIINLNLDLKDDELFISQLWKTFFKTVAIKERENKKCQQNFMPKKYWKNIIEMEDEV